jgi:hypothetical protein
MAALANSPRGSVLTYALNDASPDASQILSYLTTFRNDFQTDPTIRVFAANLLKLAGVVSDNDVPGQVSVFFCWVKDNMKYLADPTGVEFVISPKRLIEDIATDGFAYGDCDDHCLLFGTLLGAVGVTNQFVAVKLFDPVDFDHVIVSVKMDWGWMDLDPCNKETTGQVEFAQRLLAPNA